MVFDPSQVPWANRMRRIQHRNAPPIEEWMAPDDVVADVVADYLDDAGWLSESSLLPIEQRWSASPLYLSGKFLFDYRRLVIQEREEGAPPFIGVLRADHHVSVRYFKAEGDMCLLVDTQTQRRMAIYDARTRARAGTQDLGSAVLVYRMIYLFDGRWRIDRFIQQLPVGWMQRASTSPLREVPGWLSIDQFGGDY